MPKDKTKMHEMIMNAAKEEFLNNGFEDASMRTIAAKAGITVSGIYKHFRNKDEMFGSLIQPILTELKELIQQFEQAEYQFIDEDDIEGMWMQEADMHVVMDYVYAHYTEFKLLICCSSGSSYCDFLEEISLGEEKATLAFMKQMEKKGMHVHFLPENEMHILVRQIINAMFDTIVYDFGKEEAMHYIDTISKVYMTGMRKVLEF